MDKRAGCIGYYTDGDALLVAIKAIRAQGIEAFDAYSPFPIHGFEAAANIRRSWIPFVTFAGGLTGLCCGFILQYWTSAVDWPVNVAGKPFNSWPAFVPVMFECTILFAALSSVAAMFIVNRLPNHRNKAFDPALTRDAFALVIEPAIEDARAQAALATTGATGIRSVFVEGWS